MTTQELWWAAGFLEGEGCFGVNRSHGRFQSRLAVAQVQKEPLERLQGMFGGRIHPRPYSQKNKNWQDQWAWAIHGRHAREVMQSLLPLMSPKRQEQIQRVLRDSGSPTGLGEKGLGNG